VGVEDDEDEDEDEDEDDGDGGDEAEPKGPEATATVDGQGAAGSYQTPEIGSTHFLETFQGNWVKKWVYATAEKYAGRFEVGVGKKAQIPGDKGLIVTQKAKHYGMSALVTSPVGSTFSIQYETRFDEGINCGGAYLKFPTGFTELEKFDNDVKYSIMFGPDKCGGTSKVHFIFQSKNPSNGKFVEHHLKSPPTVPTSREAPHLFTLNIDGDSYDVLVDGESKKSGKLSEDFEPPVQPPKEIDDSEDKKPEDWVDAAKIADPEATKPEDWDEDAPKQIEDMEAVKPEGWLDNEEDMIPDPNAVKPETWDDEEDGAWEAPLISNPKCEEAGCGEWKRPMKANPDYKGKWKAPMIDNPEYKGEWKPRKISNPEYYVVDKVQFLPISAVGVEIWTMDQGFVFDNILIAPSAEVAKQFAEATFGKKRAAFDAAEKKNRVDKKPAAKVLDSASTLVAKAKTLTRPVDDMLRKAGMGPAMDQVLTMAVEKPVIVSSVSVLFLFTLLLLCCSGKPRKSDADDVADAKKTDESTPDDQTVTQTGVASVTPSEPTPSKETGLRQRPIANRAD